MKVEWTAPAEADLASIDTYWMHFGEDQADRMLERIHAGGDFLAELPHAGAAMDDIDVRKWGIRGTAYLLLYRVLNDRVQILRVRHTAEDWRA